MPQLTISAYLSSSLSYGSLCLQHAIHLVCSRLHHQAPLRPCSWHYVCVSCSVMSNSLRPQQTVGQPAPLSIGFSRQEYWSGLPFSSLGDLLDPGIEPRSPALQADPLLSEPPGKLIYKNRFFRLFSILGYFKIQFPMLYSCLSILRIVICIC